MQEKSSGGCSAVAIPLDNVHGTSQARWINILNIISKWMNSWFVSRVDVLNFDLFSAWPSAMLCSSDSYACDAAACHSTGCL